MSGRGAAARAVGDHRFCYSRTPMLDDITRAVLGSADMDAALAILDRGDRI